MHFAWANVEAAIGSGIAPKMFGGSTPYGTSPQTPIATQTKPEQQISGAPTPSLAGYSTQAYTDPSQSPANPSLGDFGGAGDIDQIRQRLRDMRGNGPMPFYG